MCPVRTCGVGLWQLHANVLVHGRWGLLDASMVCREFRRAAHGRAEAESEEGPDDADDKEGSADLSGTNLPPASPTTTPSLAAQCSPCLGAHRQVCPLSRSLFVQHCSLCIASPPMYL